VRSRGRATRLPASASLSWASASWRPLTAYSLPLASFQIDGDAAYHLSPGVAVPLDISFTNPHAVPLTVSDLRVTLKRIDAPAADGAHPCSSEDFELTQLVGSVRLTLPPRTTSGLRELHLPVPAWPQVALRNRAVNQDGCKGATLTLDYRARGELGD
jgi:hypothetical protein